MRSSASSLLEHHNLDEQIHNLATRHHLSEPEQVEEVTLKAKLRAEGSDGNDPAAGENADGMSCSGGAGH